MANYRLSQIAREDLIRIFEYGADRFGINQAERYFNVLVAHFERIAENPLAFESVEYIRKGYRRCTCGSHTIYYRVFDGEVEIMTIIGRQELHNI